MTGPALAAAWRHGPGKEVRASGPSRPAARASGVRPPVLSPALARTLTLALAPRRWEPGATHNDHRAYPSPRAAHLADVTLRLDRSWPLDPVRLGPGDPAGATAAELDVTVAPDRLPEEYGPLREALALLEAGHLLGALAEAAGACGLTATTTVHTGRTVATMALAPGNGPTWSRSRVTAERSSGRDPRGLSADPRPLPAAILDRLVAAGGTVPAGSPATGPVTAGPSAAGSGPVWTGALRHRLAVHGVTGLPDGLYGPDRRLIAAGPATQRLQAASRVGPGELDVAGMNVVWALSADVAAAVGRDGPTAYPRSLVAAGAAAQHVCSAAAGLGLFCRPVRAVDEPVAEAALGLDPGQDLLYLLLLGRPRYQGPVYDLTDPGGPA